MSKNETQRNISEQVNDLKLLHTDLQDYNQQFSMGVSLGTMLIKAMKGQIGKSLTNRNLVEEQKEDQAKATKAVQLKNSAILDEIGLSLSPAETGEAFIGQGTTVNLKKLHFNISNHSDFIKFLEQIDGSNENIENTSLKELLNTIIETLSKQVFTQYTISKNQVSDEFLSLIVSAEKIINIYKNIGLEASTKKLETILKHSRENNLSEYIQVVNARINSEKNFSAKLYPPKIKWDIAPTHFEKEWENTIKTLEGLKENPRANKLYKTSLNLCTKKLTELHNLFQKKSELPKYIQKETYDKFEDTTKEILKKILDL